MSGAPSSSTILVTGAAGFIAHAVCSRLLKAGHHVVGLDNLDSFYARSVKEKNVADLRALPAAGRFQFVEGDILDVGHVLPAGMPWKAVVHLAARAGVRPSLADPAGYLKTNVEGTLRVLEWCVANHVDQVVFGSSSSVYGDDTPAPFLETASADHPVSPYAASKRAAELYCRTFAHLHGLKVAMLRFFTAYGPRQRPDLAIHLFARKALAGQPVTMFGDGSTARDYTYVEDIAAGVVAALAYVERSPAGTCEAINLGGSATTTLAELLAALEVALGVPISRQHAPPQPGDVQLTSASVEKASALLGWAPTTSLQDGLAAFAAWLAT